MLIVAIASQKGGSGKTTLAGHLAVEAEKAGAGPVALIDTDPQGSLSQWWNARVEKSPAFAKAGVFELESALHRLKQSGIRMVVIDTPPAVTDSISHVISFADLVIVPTRPSPHDLRAVGATVDLVQQHKKALIFVVNGATARARITSEAAVALSQHGTVAPVTIHNRVDFAASMVDGRTIGEVVAKSQSAKEIADLWIYLQDRLARFSNDAALSPEIQPRQFAVRALSAGPEESEPPGLPPEIAVVDDSPGTPCSPPEMSIVSSSSPTVTTEAAPNGASNPEAAQPWSLPERRSAGERPQNPRAAMLFGASERRAYAFGRRHTDHSEMARK